jgi:hypothetical protein
MFTVDNKTQAIKRCELPTVIVTVHGSCYFGGYICTAWTVLWV